MKNNFRQNFDKITAFDFLSRYADSVRNQCDFKKLAQHLKEENYRKL